MNSYSEDVVRRAYADARRAAEEKGLSGSEARRAVCGEAARVASRMLGTPVSCEDVERLMQQPF